MTLYTALYIVGYSVPIIIAAWHNGPNRKTAMWLGLLTGWTVIGWVLALLLATSGPRGAGVPVARVDEQQAHEAQFRAFCEDALQPKLTPGLSLNTNEHCYWLGPAEKVLRVTQTHREGIYGGPSVRLARGLYMRAGATRSRNVSTAGPQVVDRGTLYITNARIIFTGANGTEVLPYTKIVAYQTYSDGFHIDAANAPRVLFLTNEKYAGWTMTRVRNGWIDAQSTTQEVGA